ncbi:acyltransferase ChoActase/COT/CPT [Jimgerdemannia flammicorona]|uniref:Uncharacterized protein n=2 Tax=Jimgerdemannia flammicorona TaxID=994334 RepID=A0A433QM90_9FUNG|nr:acyltransferase ChoActase/COT/CPT [Jimgerdemannia flammicorona]RUS30885.1 hypothetical protein BC938DRAFT_478818 [Jimgerdemannia flammicorona]
MSLLYSTRNPSLVWFTMTTNKPTTFQFQSTLPHLPIPSLEETCARYLHSLRPVLTPAELAQTEAHIADFLKPGGVGQRAQQQLIDLDRASPFNWLDDNFWLRKAYHEWREPLIVNSNWYMLGRDDENHPRELLEINGGVREKGDFSNFQIKRAAKVVTRTLDFKDMVDFEQLPPDVARGKSPLCMYQYTRLFGVTRIPQPVCDTFAHTPHPNIARHIVVLLKDQIYPLDVYDEVDGRKVRVSEKEIESRLKAIVSDVHTSPMLAPIPLLTADHRDRWTEARAHLLTLSPTVNRESLSVIESAILAVSLDDFAVGTALDKWTRNVATGTNGHNRWFDKSLTIIVESNGKCGLNGEHSPCDALVAALVLEYMLAGPTTSHLEAAAARGPRDPFTQLPLSQQARHHADAFQPRKLEWVTNEVTQRYIAECQARTDKIIADSDTDVLLFEEYGTDFTKRVGKISPDAYMQMALQLAFYKLHHTATPTYETASTRAYLHGRTETTRTLSVESKRFVEHWESTASVPQKYALLKAAADAHVKYMTAASKGFGCDRHLLGLRLLAATLPADPRNPENPARLPPHSLFTDPAYARSQNWRLSTSGLHDGRRLMGTGFGAVVPDGYGVNYMAAPELVKFGIECKKSAKETASATEFKEAVRWSLREIASVCKEVNGEGGKGGRKGEAKL